MNKMNLTLVSLVGAIPAGFLVVVLVMSFLSYADKMSGTLKGLAGATLGMVAVLLLMPAAILVFGAKTRRPDEAAAPDAAAPEETVADEAEVADEAAEAVEGFEAGEAIAEGDAVEEGEVAEIADDFGEGEAMADAEVVEEAPPEDEFVFDEEQADENKNS